MLDISWANKRIEATMLVMKAGSPGSEGQWRTDKNQQGAGEGQLPGRSSRARGRQERGSCIGVNFQPTYASSEG